MSPPALLLRYVELHNQGVRGGEENSFVYSWARSPGARAGRLRLIERGGRIAELVASREPA